MSELIVRPRRKRKATDGLYVRPRPLKRTRRTFIRGQDRVGGYYGRYSGAGAETKFFDLDLDDAIIATGANVTDSINKIGQGVTESTRVGRKCTIKSIQWRYQLSLPKVDAAVSAAASSSVRVILYLDKQCNGATAVGTDVLETGDIHSFRNLSNSGRFVLMYDKTHSINYTSLASDNAAVVSSANVFREYTMYKKCNTPIEFNDTTGAITEIRSNNFGVLIIGNSGTGGFNSKIRLRFSDA